VVDVVSRFGKFAVQLARLLRGEGDRLFGRFHALATMCRAEKRIASAFRPPGTRGRIFGEQFRRFTADAASLRPKRLTRKSRKPIRPAQTGRCGPAPAKGAPGALWQPGRSIPSS